MVQYLGDFAEDSTVYIPFNTFTSDDPAASATITDLADADIKVHKDGSTTEITTDGATVSIDFDGITGNHLVTIDTSADAAYSTGSDYLVRIEGTTVDGATGGINVWIGQFSIENRKANVTGISTINTNVSAIKTVTDNLPDSGALTTIDTNLDAVLADTGTDGVVLAGTPDVNAAQISGSAAAADNLEASALRIVSGAATATTLGTTQMSTDLTEATDDHYIGRIIIWTSGTLADQATDITDYNGTTKTLTFSATTEAPSDTDTFIII